MAGLFILFIGSIASTVPRANGAWMVAVGLLFLSFGFTGLVSKHKQLVMLWGATSEGKEKIRRFWLPAYWVVVFFGGLIVFLRGFELNVRADWWDPMMEELPLSDPASWFGEYKTPLGLCVMLAGAVGWFVHRRHLQRVAEGHGSATQG